MYRLIFGCRAITYINRTCKSQVVLSWEITAECTTELKTITINAERQRNELTDEYNVHLNGDVTASLRKKINKLYSH